MEKNKLYELAEKLKKEIQQINLEIEELSRGGFETEVTLHEVRPVALPSYSTIHIRIFKEV